MTMTMHLKAPLIRLWLMRRLVLVLERLHLGAAIWFGNWALAHMSMKCRVGRSPWMKVSLADAGTFQPKKGD